MQQHEQRVIDELKELNTKLEGLVSFVGSMVFDSLEAEDKFLLCKQRDEMKAYAETLDARIARFC